MNRRTLLKCCAGLAVVACNNSMATGAVNYSREIYEAALASGEPFLLDFTASW